MSTLTIFTPAYNRAYTLDVLSANFSRNLRRNPKGFALYYKDVLRYRIVPLKDKIKAFVRLSQCIVYRMIK